MLVAKNQHNEILCTVDFTRDVLHRRRRKEQFFCPQCQAPVTLKIGAYKIPHFAHYHSNNCRDSFSEGETLTHIEGKVQLYRLFKRLQIAVELEPYLAELQQRPDLLISHNNTRYAIEFQYSAISYEKLQQRTAGYRSADITALWLFATPKKYETVIDGIMTINLRRTYEAVVSATHGFITYSPARQSFIYFGNLLHVKGSQYITKKQSLHSSAQHFPFLQPQYISEAGFTNYWQQYKVLTQKYCQQKLRYPASAQDMLLRSCYELRLAVHELPPIIGVPIHFGVRGALPMAVDWQCAWLYAKQQGLTNEAFLLSWQLPITPTTKQILQKYHDLYQLYEEQQLTEKELIKVLFAKLFAI